MFKKIRTNKKLDKSNLILVRHGQSEWNKLDRFTGWMDVGLSEKGIEEAKSAGKKIKDTGILFDNAFTSILQRSIQTFDQINKIFDISVNFKKDWRLNERHYGALQGLSKQKMRDIHGDEQVLIWRRSYDVRPPELEKDEFEKLKSQECFLGHDIDPFPKCESLKDTFRRLMPFIDLNLIPLINSNKNILISAHGNSIRAMLKFFEKISDHEIVKVEIPTGEPLHLSFNHELKLLDKKYL